MPSSGATKPEGATSFDGEEPTEVIELPRAPQKTIEMRLPGPVPGAAALKDEEGPDRTYLAPRSIPTQAVPEQGPEDNKIVINVKTPAPGEVATELKVPDQPKIDADRARRRAPTVRIERGTLSAQGLLPSQSDDIDVSFDGEVDAVEPPPDLHHRQQTQRAESGDGWTGRDGATKVAKPAPKRSPAVMILVGIMLVVALGGGTVFALGYFGIVDVPGVPQSEPEAGPATKPAPTTTALPTSKPTMQPVERAPTADATQTLTAESAAPAATSAPLRPSATAPKPPFVKPRWVPPASTRANPTTI